MELTRTGYIDSIRQGTVDMNGQTVHSKNGHPVIENANHHQYVCL